MENTNKPQWLIDAENEIKNFENTEFGKLSDKEFNFKEKQSNAGTNGGNKAKETGQVYEAAVKGREIYSTDPRLKTNAQKMGNTQGKKNVESGHLAKVRNPKKSGAVSGSIIRHCNRCGKELKGNAAMNMHTSYHKTFDNISLLIKDSFSIKQLKNILITELLFTDTLAFKKASSYANDKYYSIKIYNGTIGSNNDVSIYKKRETLS